MEIYTKLLGTFVRTLNQLKCFTIYQPSFKFNIVFFSVTWSKDENSLYQLEAYTPLHQNMKQKMVQVLLYHYKFVFS